jgi:hypothetical protein
VVFSTTLDKIAVQRGREKKKEQDLLIQTPQKRREDTGSKRKVKRKSLP